MGTRTLVFSKLWSDDERHKCPNASLMWKANCIQAEFAVSSPWQVYSLSPIDSTAAKSTSVPTHWRFTNETDVFRFNLWEYIFVLLYALAFSLNEAIKTVFLLLRNYRLKHEFFLFYFLMNAINKNVKVGVSTHSKWLGLRPTVTSRFGKQVA